MAVPTDGAAPPAGMWAFIDEYGDSNLRTEIKDVSERFILVAVIVRGSELASLRAETEAIRARHFQAGEMKAKRIAGNRARWIRVLSDVASLAFTFYALVVDKREILRTSGLQWSDAFYKYLSGKVYGKLTRVHPGMNFVADAQGSSESMASFQRYIREHHRLTLFERPEVRRVDSSSEPLVQLADIICGALARCYDTEKKVSKPEEFLNLLSKQALTVDEWPVRFRFRSDGADLPEDARPDDRIAAYSYRLAEDFIERHEGSKDEEERVRVAVVQRLLFERRFGEGSKPVATLQLIDNLRDQGFGVKTETWIRRSVIAPLRDRGLLITSSSGGYKLPEKRSDVLAFIRHAEAVCVPMLNRAKRAADEVKIATNREVDVLQDGSIKALKKLVEALDDGIAVEEPEEPWA